MYALLRFPSSVSRRSLGTPDGRHANLAAMLVIGLLLLIYWPLSSDARILEDRDFESISRIRTLFMDLTTDITQSLKRTDIPSGEADCLKMTLQDLMQASRELGSYEYLITIESEIGDFGDDKALREILQFAVAKTLEVLEIERKHMVQFSEQCSRFPLSLAKTKQAMQFIDATVGILNAISPRLSAPRTQRHLLESAARV
jgi:hypothetical protein